MTIIWNAETMSTGMPTVDAEHQEWIRRFNEFEDAILLGSGTDAVQKMLDFMVEYSETHFVHEELLSDGMDTPAARLNRTEHNHFRVKVQEMRKWVKENGVTLVEVISLEMDLEAWLVHHICNVDAQVWMRQKLQAEFLPRQSVSL